MNPKVPIVVPDTSGVKGGPTRRTAVLGRQVLLDAQNRFAAATENRGRIELIGRPALGSMVGGHLVADKTRIEDVTARKSDGDDVPRPVVVCASTLRANLDPAKGHAEAVVRLGGVGGPAGPPQGGGTFRGRPAHLSPRWTAGPQRRVLLIRIRHMRCDSFLEGIVSLPASFDGSPPFLPVPERPFVTLPLEHLADARVHSGAVQIPRIPRPEPTNNVINISQRRQKVS